jgi:hypothetical protein
MLIKVTKRLGTGKTYLDMEKDLRKKRKEKEK